MLRSNKTVPDKIKDKNLHDLLSAGDGGLQLPLALDQLLLEPVLGHRQPLHVDLGSILASPALLQLKLHVLK